MYHWGNRVEVRYRHTPGSPLAGHKIAASVHEHPDSSRQPRTVEGSRIVITQIKLAHCKPMQRRGGIRSLRCRPEASVYHLIV